jgi:SagB-type dehydrogenase family enzyme
LSKELATDKGHFLIHLYLYIHRVDDLEPGIYYYDRIKQVLVPLSLNDQKDAAKFFSCFQDIAADGCFAASMVADLNQAYRLYGDRGYRFVHYEAGWVGQCLYLSSLALGYESTGIGCFIDDLINKHLGLEDGFEVVYNFTVGRAVDDPRLTTLPSYSFSDPTAGLP